MPHWLWRWKMTACGTLFALAAGSVTAAAVPPPKSTDKLQAESDLVARVFVRSVTCVTNGPPSRYRAVLELREVRKGKVRPGATVSVAWRSVTGRKGPWAVYYYPGEEAWAYLKREAGAYATTWRNGKKVISQKTLDLPVRSGQTLKATDKLKPVPADDAAADAPEPAATHCA